MEAAEEVEPVVVEEASVAAEIPSAEAEVKEEEMASAAVAEEEEGVDEGVALHEIEEMLAEVDDSTAEELESGRC